MMTSAPLAFPEDLNFYSGKAWRNSAPEASFPESTKHYSSASLQGNPERQETTYW